jgi:hypothetical protein
MKTIFSLLFVAFFLPYCFGQESSADVAFRNSTAARIGRIYGVTVDPNTTSLRALLDVESRLQTSSRILRNYGLNFDYQSNSLSTLLDAESRMGTAARLKRNFGVDSDWKTQSLSQLVATESRLYSTRAAQSQTTNTRVESTSHISPPATIERGGSKYYDYSYRPEIDAHYVQGYFRRNGTYVSGHYQTNPDGSFWNNYSSAGNVNPYTGKVGTKLPQEGSLEGGSTYVNGYFRKDGTYVSGYTRSR